MTIPKRIFIFTTIGVLCLANTAGLDAQVIPNKIIAIQGEIPFPSETPVPSCNLLEKINEYDDLLDATPLKFGSTSIPYFEIRAGKKKDLSEPSKEIALKVLNTRTCETQIVVITKSGGQVISPDGWDIQVMERTSGIKWNDWNTVYAIKNPEHFIVVKNKYPDLTKHVQNIVTKTKAGKKLTTTKTTWTAEYRTYVPYSDALHTPEVVAAGKEYLDNLVKAAYTDLADRNVQSKAYPGVRIKDLSVFQQDFFKRLPVIEHADFGEFVLSPQITTERVLVLIATNREKTSQYTCNKAGACGLFQFTDNGTKKNPGTYSMLRQRYPQAGLIPDFEAGAQDHFNSMKAAILLYDTNLAYLMNKYGAGIANDGRIEEYLAALYNASPKKVTASLTATIQRTGLEWTGKLLTETKGYIAKLRYLRDNRLISWNVPTDVAD